MTEKDPNARARYAARETYRAISYDPRDGREVIRISHDESEIIADQRRLIAAKITPYRPAEFGMSAEQYYTDLTVAERESHECGTAARREVRDSLAAARAYLRGHVPGYDDAPRRDAVRERTRFDVAAGDQEIIATGDEGGYIDGRQ